MIYFKLCEVVGCAELGRNIVASPDQNDMYEGQSRQCTENGTHRQVITCCETFLVDLDKNEANAHDSNSYPGEYPNDDECRVKHLDKQVDYGYSKDRGRRLRQIKMLAERYGPDVT